MRLHLVVAGHRRRIRRRHLCLRPSRSIPAARHARLLLRVLAIVLVLVAAVVGGAVVHAALGLGLVLPALRLDVHILHAAAALAVVAVQRLVLVGRLGVLGDDVPGVQEAGDVAEDAEEDVDEGVGAADAALDPDWRRLVH